MRKNLSGDTYVHSAKELLDFLTIDKHKNVYLSFMTVCAQPLGTRNRLKHAIGEIASGDGKLICRVEADTEDEVISILRESDIQIEMVFENE